MGIDISLQRCIRDNLLKETDKYVLPDYPISPEKLVIIKQYRQALRDYTNNLTPELEENPEFPKFPF